MVQKHLRKALVASCLLLPMAGLVTPEPLEAGSKRSVKKGEAGPSKEEISSTEQIFALRRLIDAWANGDHQIARGEAKRFLKAYPHSKFHSQVYAILGDIEFDLKNWHASTLAYEKIEIEPFLAKTWARYLHGLYEMKNWSKILKESEVRMPSKGMTFNELQDAQFYVAEAVIENFMEVNDLESLSPQVKSFENDSEMVEALSLYLPLKESPYKPQVLQRISAIHQYLGDSKLAAEALLTLAEESPTLQLKAYFDAAALLRVSFPSQARPLFDQVRKVEGPLQKPATFYWLWTSLELGEIQSILSGTDWLSLVPENDVEMTEFILARAHLLEGNSIDALRYFSEFIDGTKPEAGLNEYRQYAFADLFSIAYQQKEETLLSKYTELFKREYPRDKDYYRALFLRASLNEESLNLEQSLKDYQLIMQQYPEFERVDTALLHSGLIQVQMGDWMGAWSSLDLFTREYPEHESGTLAWQGYLRASSELMALPGVQDTNELRIQSMMTRLSESREMTEKEKAYHISLGTQRLLENKQYEDLLQWVSFARHYGKDSMMNALSYFNEALASRQLGLGMDRFEHLIALSEEKAEDEDFLVQSYLVTYNQYLDEAKLAKENHLPFDEWKAKGAQFLWKAYALQPERLHSEHHIWLAHYHYDQIKPPTPHKRWQAVALDPLFLEQTTYEALPSTLSEVQLTEARFSYEAFKLFLKPSFYEGEFLVTPGSESLEKEYFKMARVAYLLGNYEEATTLLNSLRKSYQENPEGNWKLISPTLAYLSVACELSGKNWEAYEAYMELLNQIEDLDYWAPLQLHASRVGYLGLKHEEKERDNPKLEKVSQALNQVQQRKSLKSEPYHIESAIERSQILARTYRASEEGEALLNQLNEVKHNFTQAKDISTQEYNNSKENFPKQARLQEAYLLLLDAMIAQLEFEQSASRLVKGPEVEIKSALAKSLYKSLLTQDYALTGYIIDQANSGLEALKNKERGL